MLSCFVNILPVQSNTSTSLFAITLLSCFENYNNNTKVKCHERICHGRYDDIAFNFFDQLSDQTYHEASVRGNAEYPTTSIALTSKVAMQRGINSSVLEYYEVTKWYVVQIGDKLIIVV